MAIYWCKLNCLLNNCMFRRGYRSNMDWNPGHCSENYILRTREYKTQHLRQQQQQQQRQMWELPEARPRWRPIPNRPEILFAQLFKWRQRRPVRLLQPGNMRQLCQLSLLYPQLLQAARRGRLARRKPQALAPRGQQLPVHVHRKNW